MNASLVEAPLHLAQVRLEVRARLLELPDEPLQLRLGQVVPVEREGVRDLQRLVVLDLELDLGGNSIGNIKIIWGIFGTLSDAGPGITALEAVYTQCYT